MTSKPATKPFYWIALAALIAVFWALSLSAAHRESQTYDEAFHLLAGYRYVECGDFAINSEHPPLVKLLAGAAVRWTHMTRPDGVCGTEPTTKDYGYAQGMHWFYGQGADTERLMFRGRAAASVLGPLLLLGVFLFARRMFGDAAGLFAAGLAAFDPAILAHTPRVTTDIAMTAGTLFSVFAAYCWFRSRALSRLLFCGLALGATLASKHSGVLAVLVLAILFAWEGWRGQPGTAAPRRWRGALQQLGAYGCVLLVAVFTLWAFYGFNRSGRPHGAAMTLPLPGFLQLVYEQNTHGFMVDWLVPAAQRLHLAPLPYLYGLVDVWAVSHPGQPLFLLGHYYPHGRWFYFPLVFLMKTTLPFLVLLLLAAWMWVRHLRTPDGEARADAWQKLRFLLLPCCIIFAIAMTSGLDIGFRHILSIMPLLYIAVAGGMASTWRGRRWRIAAVALAALQVVVALAAWPNYLPYINQAWGGSRNGWRLTTDANVDWGQQLLEARAWVIENHVTDCWIAIDNAIVFSHFDIPCKQLPGNEWFDTDVPPVQVTGTLLVAGLAMSGIEFEVNQNPYASLYAQKQIANVGDAMPVFRGTFSLPMARAAALQAKASAELQTNPAQAAKDAQEALGLTPEGVRPRLTLADALRYLKQPQQAAEQYRLALAQIHTAGLVWYPIENAAAEDGLKKALAAKP